jgi:prolyl-tRNA editing enzyme YbaK/EbsC (Cys-tRNA(Pro) deacylase)
MMIPNKVQTVLDAWGLSALEFQPGSTPTVESAAAMIGVEPGQIAKSMLLKGKDGRFFLLVAAGDRKVSSSKLKQITGVKCSMAKGEETLQVSGFAPGGVCPFGLVAAAENPSEADPVEPSGTPSTGLTAIFLDESLKAWDLVYPAAGNDASGVPVTPELLGKIAGGTWVDGTNPR